MTGRPLGGASVFDRNGRAIGISRNDGRVTCATAADYPLTIRYVGYHEAKASYTGADTIFLTENIARLPEVVVEAKQRKMLHILAYVREYSTLSTYTDTVTMFREKMVDFMLPTDDKTRFKGWRFPRVLNTRSYYRFTNSTGLDSVSDRCSNHFTWADWIGMFPVRTLPPALHSVTTAKTDTLFGKYSPTEIWVRRDDRVGVDVNVLADTTSRRWVSNLASFFRHDDTEFEQFRLHLNYGDAVGKEVTPLELTSYSFNIESRGRGHDMFMFHRANEPFFVTTYSEVYLLDKELITVKEAKTWGKRVFKTDEIAILEPEEAPELSSSTVALIDRVHGIDADRIRALLPPDYRLMSRNVRKHNPNNLGFRALTLLKDLTGITYYKAHRNFNRNWKSFIEGRKKANAERDSVINDIKAQQPLDLSTDER